MLVMDIYTFTCKMVNKTKNPGSETVAGLTPPLTISEIKEIDHFFLMKQYFLMSAIYKDVCVTHLRFTNCKFCVLLNGMNYFEENPMHSSEEDSKVIRIAF